MLLSIITSLIPLVVLITTHLFIAIQASISTEIPFLYSLKYIYIGTQGILPFTLVLGVSIFSVLFLYWILTRKIKPFFSLHSADSTKKGAMIIFLLGLIFLLSYLIYTMYSLLIGPLYFQKTVGGINLYELGEMKKTYAFVYKREYYAPRAMTDTKYAKLWDETVASITVDKNMCIVSCGLICYSRTDTFDDFQSPLDICKYAPYEPSVRELKKLKGASCQPVTINNKTSCQFVTP